MSRSRELSREEEDIYNALTARSPIPPGDPYSLTEPERLWLGKLSDKYHAFEDEGLHRLRMGKKGDGDDVAAPFPIKAIADVSCLLQGAKSWVLGTKQNHWDWVIPDRLILGERKNLPDNVGLVVEDVSPEDLVSVVEAMHQCMVIEKKVCFVSGWAVAMAYLMSHEGMAYQTASDRIKKVKPTAPEIEKVKGFVERVVEKRVEPVSPEDLAALVAAVALLPARQRGVLLRDLVAMDF